MDIAEHTEKLRVQRMRLIHEAQSILDNASREKRGMSAEESATWDRLMADVDDIEHQVRTMDARETRERENAVAIEALGLQYGKAGAATRATSEADQLRAFLKGEIRALDVNFSSVQREKDLIRQGATPNEVRALAWDTGSVGSAVPTVTERKLYEYFEASVALMRMPTTKINTPHGAQMKFPKLNAHAIGTQVSGQGTTLAGTDPTFLSMTLDAFKYGQLVRIADEVISDTAIDIIDFVMRDVGRAVGRVVATDLAVGSGSGEPNGVMTAIGGSGTIVTGGTLIDPTVEKLIDLKYSINDAYRSGGAAAWLMHDQTAGVLSKLRDGEGGTVGAFLWQPSLTAGLAAGVPDRLLGHPVYTDPNVASLASNAKVISFGDFSSFYIRQAGDLRLERDDSVYFATDEVAVRGKIRVDSDLIDSNALNLIKRSVT